MNLPLQVLTVKILRLQGGNSIILNLGGKTKILSYVSCFYQKEFSEKEKYALSEKVPPDYFALCFILFLSISEFSPNSCLAYIPLFSVETPEMKLDYNGPDPVIISISRSGRSSALDFL